MVMIQVDEIHAKFIDIDKMKLNNWQTMASPKVTKVGELLMCHQSAKSANDGVGNSYKNGSNI